MTLAEIFESKGWKMFMAKLYGIGAAIVIVGALFKIMHWPGAGPMLIAGLSTEALIFLVSAFEPLHEEYDWALVYPALTGLEEVDDLPVSSKGKGIDAEAQTKVNKELLEAIKKIQPQSEASTLAKFDSLINNAQISPELFKKLGAGLNNLSDTTSKLSDISEASVATKSYTESIKTASDSLNLLSDTNLKASDTVTKTVGGLSESFKKNSDVVKKSNSDIATAYQMLIDSMTIDFSSVTKSNNNYSQELANLNRQLSKLNSIYELQIKNSSQSLEKSKEFYSGLDKMMGDLKDSSQESDKYRKEVANLSKKLVALNTIYGNMLSAMNVNTDKL